MRARIIEAFGRWGVSLCLWSMGTSYILRRPVDHKGLWWIRGRGMESCAGCLTCHKAWWTVSWDDYRFRSQRHDSWGAFLFAYWWTAGVIEFNPRFIRRHRLSCHAWRPQQNITDIWTRKSLLSPGWMSGALWRACLWGPPLDYEKACLCQRNRRRHHHLPGKCSTAVEWRPSVPC